jgi:hypothetical protein
MTRRSRAQVIEPPLYTPRKERHDLGARVDHGGPGRVPGV